GINGSVTEIARIGDVYTGDFPVELTPVGRLWGSLRCGISIVRQTEDIHQQCGVLNGASHRAGMGKGTERTGWKHGNPAMSWFKPHDAAESGRDTHTTTAVGADGTRPHSRRHGCRSATGGPAG